MKCFIALALVGIACLPYRLEAAIQCDTEVSSQVGINRSGYRLNRRANVFVQTVALMNKGTGPVQGPIYLVLENLSANATLANASGAAACASIDGRPYMELSAGDDALMMPGETLNIVLHFSNPTQQRITYNTRIFAGSSSLSPISGVVLTPDAFLVNTPTEVTIRALVTYSLQAGPPTVTLEQLDASNNLSASLGSLVDDGSLAAGDEIQGDALFSIRHIFQSTVQQRIRLRIKAVRTDGTTVSSPFFLDAYNTLTDEQFGGIIDVQSSAEKTYYDSVAGGLTKSAARQAALQVILDAPNVLQAGLSESGKGIWIVHHDGILGGLNLNEPGTRGGVSAVRPPDSAMPAARQTPAPGTTGNPQVGNKKVLILSPFLSDFGTTDEGAGLRTLYTGQTCPSYDVTYLSNAAVTVDVMKSLSQYGVIHISTHGDTYYNGILSDIINLFGWDWFGAQVVALTGQVATKANKTIYQTELKKGRLAIVTTGTGNYYAVLPSSISAHGGSYPDSVVFMSSCRSTFNNTMANAFLGKGAQTYLGFSEVVDSAFAFARANDFHKKWVLDPANLVTTGQSFTPGLSDGSSPPASWHLLGATNVELPSGEELQNAGFEDGALGAWTASGDGRVLTQLGGVFSPTEGNFSGVVSTGLGFTTDSGAITQKVCIPADTMTIEFDWNFTSEEFREWCGSVFQDFFRAEIQTDMGTHVIFNRRVDDLCSGTFPVPFSFDRPPGSNWSFGWKNQSIDISAIAAANAGKAVTIRFRTGDVGDSIFDTAVLVDNVKLKK